MKIIFFICFLLALYNAYQVEANNSKLSLPTVYKWSKGGKEGKYFFSLFNFNNYK